MNPDERFKLHLIFETIKMILSYNTNHHKPTTGIDGPTIEALSPLSLIAVADLFIPHVIALSLIHI